MNENKKGFNNKFQMGSISVVITVIVIVIFFVVNLVMNLIVAKFPVKIDLTAQGKFSLSADTADYIKKVDKSVEVIYLGTDNNASTYIKEPLDNIGKLNSNISIKYVDPNSNPAYFESRGIKNEDITSNTTTITIVVYSAVNKRFKTLSESDYVSQNQQTGETTFNLESVLTSAILYVSKTAIYNAYFVEGHGEKYSATLEELLVGNGYQVKKINLLMNTTFTDNDRFLFINAPTSDLSEGDITKLNEFLSNSEKLGKNAFILCDKTSGEMPNLNNYLTQNWGIKFENSMIIETDYANVGQQIYAMSSTYSSDTQLTKNIGSGQLLLTQLFSARPVKIIEATKSNIQNTSLISSTKDAFLKPSNAEIKDTIFDKQASDPAGPFDIMTLSSKITYEQETNKQLTSNLIVGGTLSLTDEFLSISQIGNAKYFLNIIQKTSGDELENQVSILPKNLTPSQLKIESQFQGIMILVIIVIIIPLLILGIGIFIWLKRRHL